MKKVNCIISTFLTFALLTCLTSFSSAQEPKAQASHSEYEDQLQQFEANYLKASACLEGKNFFCLWEFAEKTFHNAIRLEDTNLKREYLSLTIGLMIEGLAEGLCKQVKGAIIEAARKCRFNDVRKNVTILRDYLGLLVSPEASDITLAILLDMTRNDESQAEEFFEKMQQRVASWTEQLENFNPDSSLNDLIKELELHPRQMDPMNPF